MKRDKRAAHHRHVESEFAQIRCRDGLANRGIGQRLAQIRDQPGLIVLRERLHIDSER